MEKGARSYRGQVFAAGGTQVSAGGTQVTRGQDAGESLSRPAHLLEVSFR